MRYLQAGAPATNTHRSVMACWRIGQRVKGEEWVRKQNIDVFGARSMTLRRAAHPEPGHNLIVLIVLLVLTSYHYRAGWAGKKKI